MKKKNIWEAAIDALDERGLAFDTSDEQDPRGQRGQGPDLTAKTWRAGPNPKMPKQNPTSHLPGLPPERVHDPDELGMEMESDETPVPPRRRQRHDTIPLPNSYQSPGMIAHQAGNLRVNPSDPGSNKPEYDAQPLKRRQAMPTRQIPIQRSESTTGASGAGFQAPMGDAEQAAKKTYREMVDEVFMETVRKLPNGKFGVYVKNKGKKKAPKKVGEYPDKVAAREAELARGGKSGEAAKRERERLNKLKKDPKKLAKAKAKKSTKKESIINAMVDGLNEALFREEDIPGSSWDERLAALSPTALASNKKLANHTKNIQKASVASLMQAQKDLAKALKRYGKLNHGDIGTETGGKMYLPCHLSGDEDDMGPIYLYIEGGNVKLEMDESMNETLDGMEDEGHGLRGALMAFSQKHLPRIDGAKLAVVARDRDLDKWEKEHDDELSGRDGLSLHLLKHLIGAKHGRRYR